MKSKYNILKEKKQLIKEKNGLEFSKRKQQRLLKRELNLQQDINIGARRVIDNFEKLKYRRQIKQEYVRKEELQFMVQ
jgi:hypothetical protein